MAIEHEVASGRLAILLSDPPPMMNHTSVVYLKGHRVSPLALRLIEALKNAAG